MIIVLFNSFDIDTMAGYLIAYTQTRRIKQVYSFISSFDSLTIELDARKCVWEYFCDMESIR